MVRFLLQGTLLDVQSRGMSKDLKHMPGSLNSCLVWQILLQGTLLNVQASGMSDDPKHMLAGDDEIKALPDTRNPDSRPLATAGGGSQQLPGRRAEWAQAHSAASLNGKSAVAANGGGVGNAGAADGSHSNGDAPDGDSRRQLLGRHSVEDS